MSETPVPSHEKLKDPILEVLSDGKILSVDELVNALIEHMGLPENVANRKNPKRPNKSVLKYNTEWECTQLKKDNLIIYPDKAKRQITEKGREELEKKRNPLLNKDNNEPPATPCENPTGTFFDCLSTKGLEYSTETVEYFLLSLKAKQFVILSGGTGTGKTRLAQAYGEFISGCNQDTKRFKIIPVGSNWTDNRHILGYRNAISGGYTRAPSLDLLIASSGDPSNRYMLILDEMNLSHVERYLSDIISCMESGELIRLDSDGSVPESILVGDNLFIVGTVNMDETTYTFSPKVLDRANVLEFEPSFENYLSVPAPYCPAGDVAYLQDPSEGAECRRMNARNVIGEMRRGGAGATADSIIGDLEEIWKMMSDMGLPFAYRTLDEVMRFMYVAWMYERGGEFPGWRRYLDAQIHQKILPKIHGNVSILKGLESLSGFCGENGYDKSKKKLDRMASALRSNRYVTFNCRP